ncbi:MAG: hypothetical protein MK240_01115 [Opitutales bacterium]|nr:hypothetical protein [Opitutales bacterium]
MADFVHYEDLSIHSGRGDGGSRVCCHDRSICDHLTTDDEFTPYIFTDSVLTGIGWAVLGGPKSRG